MNRAVLISIRPRWCELIISGKKTVEVRKTRPKLPTPFKVYIYCTHGTGKNTLNIPIRQKRIIEDCVETGSMKSLNCPIGNCKVIGEFVCDDCALLTKAHYGYIEQNGCIAIESIKKYMGIENRRELTYSDGCYGWDISGLKIYDVPKELSEFRRLCTNDLYCESCGMYRENAEPCGNMSLILRRPPQSWCYVEELKGGEG